jgi:peptidoglycan/LPS O-acetylase OafA/YrhL
MKAAIDNAQSRGRFVALDSLRGVAASGVKFYHFGVFGVISAWPLFRFGHIFVDFFFVLSGFVIASAYGERLAHGFSRATFLLLRLGRVYPLHIVMVAAYAVAKLASGRSLFEGAHGPGYLARAVFLLDGFATDVQNYFNGVSWSISTELVAYILCALLFGSGRYGMLIAVAIWLAAGTAFVSEFNVIVFSTSLQGCLIGFGLGVVCHAIYRRTAFTAGPRASSMIELVMLLLAGSLIIWAGDVPWRILVCDFAFVGLILAFSREGGVLSRFALTAPMQALGRWSYSIYMVHPFVISAFTLGLPLVLARLGHAELVRQSGNLDGLRTVELGTVADTMLTLLVGGICIAIASQTFRMIEKPGRDWARRKALRQGKGDAERVAPTI